eukprot:CAMPEP_0202858158 /NCGR_PEP_ID=MMETSP1391-20130828/810_1 /ASSEMBLY_ACC=CAM_ASM_000867 /TAXON_ID=1034604 /ORGANISM="Chlamydomonas leiostraca, Strain SAG 11-49" /LENGTH=91 /DNA_ID=CAMNT_0049537045 /DNA_START=275 /DNA_END=550 /DNA_ORIENTATION=+
MSMVRGRTKVSAASLPSSGAASLPNCGAASRPNVGAACTIASARILAPSCPSSLPTWGADSCTWRTPTDHAAPMDCPNDIMINVTDGHTAR